MKIVSVSKLKTLQTCPKKYWHNHINKTKPAFVANSLVLGDAVHKTFQSYYEGGRAIDPESFFHNEYDRLINVHETEENCPVRYGDWANYADDIKRGKEMLRKFLERQENYHSDGIFCEVAFIVPIEGTDYHLYGIIDKLTPNQDGSVDLSDYKTTKAKLEPWFLTNDLQMTGYIYGLQRGVPVKDQKTLEPLEDLKFLFGQLPRKVTYIALHSQTTGRKAWHESNLYNEIFPVTADHSNNFLREARPWLKQLDWHIESDIWPKASKDPTTSACNECPFQGACWSAQKPQMTLSSAIVEAQRIRNKLGIPDEELSPGDIVSSTLEKKPNNPIPEPSLSAVEKMRMRLKNR